MISMGVLWGLKLALVGLVFLDSSAWAGCRGKKGQAFEQCRTAEMLATKRRRDQAEVARDKVFWVKSGKHSRRITAFDLFHEYSQNVCKMMKTTGQVQMFTAKGKLVSNEHCRAVERYTKPEFELHGAVRTFFPTGRLSSQGEYWCGWQTGPWLWLDEAGTVLLQRDFGAPTRLMTTSCTLR